MSSQHRALLVVESPGLELFYREALTGAGFEVLSAPNGETGLSYLRTPQPEVVILDMVLPGMTGLEFIRNLRVQRGMAPPPVFVLPLLDEELAAAATSAGAARVLSRSQAPLRTLVLLAHTHVRLRGTPLEPRPLDPAAWLPYALEHVLVLHNSVHALTRDANDAAALRKLPSEAHGLAEMLHLAGMGGLAELASAMESMILGWRNVDAELSRQSLQTLGQAVDFIGRKLEEQNQAVLAPLAGSKVLVVDDEPSLGMLVSAALGLSGLTPQVAASPSECLKAVGDTTFDLIVLDIGLPEMTGFDVCTKIRGTPGHANVPILFLTGLTSFQNRAKSVMIGGNDFICKPFDPLELALKVLLWIQQSRANVG